IFLLDGYIVQLVLPVIKTIRNSIILNCIFSEKIHFDENKVAAISFHTPIEVLLNASKVLQRSKKEKEVKKDLLPIVAPRDGLEPTTP
ncbi:MAG: hypothetical protein ACKOFE_08905, partial [Bacteroidota bacterium]